MLLRVQLTIGDPRLRSRVGRCLDGPGLLVSEVAGRSELW